MKIVFFRLPYIDGLTLQNLVIIDPRAKDIPYTIAHEACHVRQWEEHGFFKFIYLYAKETIKNGYYDNRFEMEARHYGLSHRGCYAQKHKRNE